MTGLLERSTETPASASPAPARAAGFWVRWRVAARLARRQVRRTRLSSLLVTVLIALPIAGMTVFIVFAMSGVGEPDERVRVELGQMQAWVAPGGVPDAGFWQAPTQPERNGYPLEPSGGWTIPEGSPPDDPMMALPAGTEAVKIVSGATKVDTRAGVAVVAAWAGTTWDPRLTGVFDLVEGERPAARDEAMVTPAALDRLDIALGDEMRLTGGDTFRVVGTLDAASLPDSEPAVFLPGAQEEAVGTIARWYLPDLALSWADVQDLNDAGIVAFSREVVLDPPTIVSDDVRSAGDSWWLSVWSYVLVLAVTGLFAAYVVVMLAGAAFAVAARRQQRALAVAASVGADRGDLSRTIRLQGTTLGAVGGVVGVLAGVGIAAIVMRVVDDGSATQFWGFHVPWVILVGIFLFAVVVGTLSALVPARAVARTEPLRALRGARKPRAPRASRPAWGSVLLLGGVAITVISAFLTAAVNASGLAWDSPLRATAPVGIVVGPIVAQLGILLSGGWLLWLAARGLSRLGLAAKIAARDAAANASRTVPAFAAIAATVFIGVFAVGQVSMMTAQTARGWFWGAPIGSLALEIWPNFAENAVAVDPKDADAAATTAIDLAAEAGAVHAGIVRMQDQTAMWAYPNPEDLPDDATFVMALLPEHELLDRDVQDHWISAGENPGNPLSVIDPEDIGTVLGIEPSASQLSAYRDGAAIVADPRYVTDGTIDVAAWAGADVLDGAIPGNIWTWADGDTMIAAPAWREQLPAVVVAAADQPVSIAISPGTADRLGVDAVPTRVVAAFDAPVSVDDRDRLVAQAGLATTLTAMLTPRFEDGPPSDVAWIVPILGAVSVLVLGASGVALGLARFERRPDDATLAAVGGTRGLRRRIGFWQGLIIAGFGTLAGAVAGVLPPIGFAIQSQGTLLLGDIPWWVIGAVTVGLPLAIAVVAWLVPPRHPDLTRRTAIA